jgi:4-amino-4-deoxy-L-arabinose transferase-like glycosyltransferase
MAAAKKITPPFGWLGRHLIAGSTLIILAIAAAFRFFDLPELPPGMYTGAATTGLQATNLANHGWLPGLNLANQYAPVWVWLQALSIKFMGHTLLALQIWPALLGTVAVLTTWLWAREWFGHRIAWVTAFLLAVTPWAVTLSRNGVVDAIFPLLTTLTLWTATLAWRKGSAKSQLGFGAALLLDLVSGPIGWLVAATALVTGAVLLGKQRTLFKFNAARGAGLAGLGIGLAVLAYMVGSSMTAVKELPAAANLVHSADSFFISFYRTLLMFNVHGDDNYRHNLSSEPMLNAFVGLMLVAGLLVVISRLHERRYRLLLLFTGALLLPGILTTTGAPNAARVFAAAPLILAIASVGISYMLELWYKTFPINSAARATGQAAIIVLLALTLFQGYTQYFKAWGGSSQVYTAYNEGTVQLAGKLADDAKDKNFKGTRFVVAAADEQPIAEYLDAGQVQYTAIQASQLNGLPINPGTRRFWITSSQRDEAVKSLKLKFPGGVLRPHYSDFNQTEIYYTYEATK